MKNSVEKISKEDLSEGCLLIINLGDEKTKPTASDFESMKELVMSTLKDIDGVKVMILPYNVKVTALSLKQLRKVEGEIIDSWQKNDDVVLDDFDV